MLPLITTITTWKSAVISSPASEILRVLIPFTVESSTFVLVLLSFAEESDNYYLS
ncbi:MAG: hypothetical protein Q7S39_01685 [Ignavibacteria bacterium]|nr:hypothetical protein [Ignavibacteria bacterium]